MKFICARIRRSLTTEIFPSCVCIFKLGELHDEDYQQNFQMVYDRTQKQNSAELHPAYVKHNLFLSFHLKRLMERT